MNTVRLLRILLLVEVIITSVPQSAGAQAANPAASPVQSIVGAVTKIDAETRTITLKTDQNQEFAVSIQPAATYQRVAPGETDLRNAVTVSFTAIAIGDRVLARGPVASNNVSATSVVVMSQTDLTSRQIAEKADWDKRGISGVVTAIESNSVTVNTSGPAGVSSIVIGLAQGAVVRRYAPDSVNFSEARLSKLEEIKIGDQVRARGDKIENGSRINAIEVVAGTFKTIAGLVLSVDAAKNEVRIRDLDAKTPVVVKINIDSKVQKIVPQVAQSIAARLRPEAAGTRGGRGGAGNGGDIQQLLEASPAMKLADLKNGDAVVISSSVGSTTGTITAIRFIAGVEPILTKPGTKEMSIGAWTLDVGGGGGGGGGQ